jgi:hypothetical protein
VQQQRKRGLGAFAKRLFERPPAASDLLGAL